MGAANRKQPADGGSEPEPEKPRMLVNGVVGKSDPRYNEALALYKGAVYNTPDPEEFQEIHCLKDQCKFIANGFYQTFSVIEGKKCRVLVYLPTQTLQPHCHDLDEDFLVTYGSAEVSCWSSPTEPPTSKRYEKGERIIVPKGTVHTLRADSRTGLVFHELVPEDSFQKRSTQWKENKALPEYLMPIVFAGKTVLVTGANRGLGLGLVTAFSAMGARVVACCRDPAKADKLKEISPEPLIVALDLASEESVKALRSGLEAVGVSHLDYLINNAGISSPNHPNDPILAADPGTIKNVFETNVIGTIMVTHECLPLLEKSPTKTVMNMSSQLGSIAGCFGVQGRYGGVASYRISRAANNMAMRCFAGELHEKGFIFVSMSPGHVATDMGSAGGRKAPLTVEQSTDGMLQVLAHAAPSQTGKFLQYDGAELEW